MERGERCMPPNIPPFPDELWIRRGELEVREANGFVRACPGSAFSSLLSQQITSGLSALLCHLTADWVQTARGYEPRWERKTGAFNVKPHIIGFLTADQVIACCCRVKHPSLHHLQFPKFLISVPGKCRCGMQPRTLTEGLCCEAFWCYFTAFLFTPTDSWRYWIL